MTDSKHSQKCISLLKHDIDCTNFLTKKALSEKLALKDDNIKLINILYLEDTKICEHEFNSLIHDKIDSSSGEAIGLYIEFSNGLNPLTILYNFKKAWLGNNELTAYIKDKSINEDAAIITECICGWGKTSVLKYRRDLLNIVEAFISGAGVLISEIRLSVNEIKSSSDVEAVVNGEDIDSTITANESMKCEKARTSIEHLMENMLHTQQKMAETQNNQILILMNLMNKLSK